MAADSYSDFSYFGTCPVVQSDKIILPFVTSPLGVESPKSLRALEESLKTDGIIFLTDDRLRVGTICRASRKWMSGAGGRGDMAGWGFMVEGLGRGIAMFVTEADGFCSAKVFSDPSPDDVPNTEQLQKLDKEVRRLLGELHPLLPMEGDLWWRRYYTHDAPISPEVEKLFNVQDIVSPSRLADRTAFLLYLLGMFSIEQQREIAETFRLDQRLETLFRVLTKAVEVRQLAKLSQILVQKVRYTGKPEIQKTIDNVLSNRKNGRRATGPLGGKSVEPLLYETDSQKEVANRLGVSTRQLRTWATENYGGWKKAVSHVRSRPRTDFE